MKEKINNLKQEINDKLKNIDNLKTLKDLKINYLSKKGPINELLSHMKELEKEEKKEFGALINNLKQEVNELFNKIEKELEKEEIEKKLKQQKIDITLPATKIEVGTPHLIERVIEDIENLFISCGYTIVEGPEIEKDLYNFEMLNLPKGHPARDAQDTFYIKDEEILLRSQTSPVQIRTMLENKEKTPIRIICPGKTYRRDDDDATHGHQFTQIEGLLVDKEVSLANLKATLDLVSSHLFGNQETRFRPSFYPFTEPSVEYDISCFNCHKKGCNICKNTGWITIGGAGIVHPNVLNNCGYDSEKYTGFAFGFGAERIAMLKYGITDLRTFYTNDLREINEFKRRDVL